MDAFINDLSALPPQPEENVFNSIWNQYERVILESLLSAFMLDFMIKDQVGGDVDTINTVRDTKEYKNSNNAKAYSDRGEYSQAIHNEVTSSGTNFQKTVARAKKNAASNPPVDGYMDKPLYFSHSKGLKTENRANLDHVIPVKQIHEDPGRILAGLKTKDIANIEENLVFTNESLNKSMKDCDKENYVNDDKKNANQHLSDADKKRIVEKKRIAENAYEKRLFQEYYLNPKNPQCRQFYKDATVAAGKQGLKMGIRQALGFFFVEVYLNTKMEVQSLEPGCGFGDIVKAVIAGLKKGFESALSKYKEILARFAEGSLAGVLSSLCTTLINIFSTTPSFFVKNIREISASVVRSSRVLLLNPDDLELGERFKTSAIILATGASILVGSYVGGLLAETPISGIPVVGDIVIRFCSTLVSGLLSCSFLIFMDRSKLMNQLIDVLNALPSEVTGMKELSAYLDKYAAELNDVDLEKFRKDSEQYQIGAEKIINANNEQELSAALDEIYKNLNLPWKGDFDVFMSNKDNHLVFE